MSRKVVIRKHGLTAELYLSRAGIWGPYNAAARFASQRAADRFAAALGISDDAYGLF